MPARSRGRPQVADTTDALKGAAARLIVRDGYSALSVEGLTKEVGTTRPTFYRRFPSLDHLVFEIVRDAYHQAVDADTGSLRSDLLARQRRDIAVLSSPIVANTLLGLLEAVRADPDLQALYREELILPRSADMARILRDAAARGEIDPGTVDSELVSDMLIGPVIARVLLPGGAVLDDDLARTTVDLVCAFLNAAGEGSHPVSR